MYKLIIYDEKGGVREFDLSPGTYGLGRSKKNEIVMDERKVSRLHATIQLDSTGDISIEDLGSKEGTFVNGERVRGKVNLKDGDEVKISTFSLEVKEWSGGGETIAMDSPDSEEASDPEPSFGPQGTIEIAPDASDNFHLVKHHKLLIISKKRFGEEYLLDKPVTTIGNSASNCEIFIDEKKVSEKHTQVEVSDGECVLKNLDTKKGTLVNGKYVKEELLLKKGDCFEVGSVTFRFIDMDEVVQKEELLSQSKTKGSEAGRRKLLIVALVAITVILVMAVLLKPKKDPIKPKTTTQQQKPKAVSSPVVSKSANVEKALSVKREADSSFNMGNELFNKRLWPEAIQQFEEVLKINPEYPGAFNKIEKARDEKNHLQAMEKARAFAAKQQYEEALKELERIPENSVYYPEGQSEIQSIKEKINERKPPKIVHKKISAPKAPSKTKMVSEEEKGNQLIDNALADYLKGHTDNAFDKLHTVIKMDTAKSGPAKPKASSLLKELEKIRDSFQNGYREYNNRQLEQAFATWSNGLNLEKKIFGGKISYYSEPIRKIIAGKIAPKARQAYESGDYAAANQHCEKALAVDPKHKDSLEIANLLYKKAKKLYEEGYIIKDLAPKQAILKMNEVLRITSPNNEYHKKAKAMLAKVEH